MDKQQQVYEAAMDAVQEAIGPDGEGYADDNWAFQIAIWSLILNGFVNEGNNCVVTNATMRRPC